MGRRDFNFDWITFITTLFLQSIGLVVLLSLDFKLFSQQAVIAISSLILFWVITRLDFSLFEYLDNYIYVGCIVLLLLTFLGPNVRGATRWLEISGFRIQPSELIKPFLTISFASFLSKFPIEKSQYLPRHLVTFFIPFLLVLIQPDLGNAVVYACIWLTLVLIGGLSPVFLILGGMIFGLIMPFGYSFLHNYQKIRLLTFINPSLDPQGTGYNALQSMITVGSGQLFGRGFGRGTQSLLKFLPEYHTDFIFATFSEEFGFIGGIILLGIFFVLLWRILTLSRLRSLHPLAMLYGMGFFIQIFIQVVVNVGMSLGVLPITGITLPYISLGGSSLLSLWIGLGIFMISLQKPLKSATL